MVRSISAVVLVAGLKHARRENSEVVAVKILLNGYRSPFTLLLMQVIKRLEGEQSRSLHQMEKLLLVRRSTLDSTYMKA